MKTNLVYTAFMIMAALAFLSVNDRAESLDIKKIIQGTVKEAKGNSIKIIEDSDGKEVPVAIDSNTVYDNAQKFTDIKAGDKVQIEYQENHNKSTATMITRIETGNEDNL
jgi:Domain of unknown function (DUF5666)